MRPSSRPSKCVEIASDDAFATSENEAKRLPRFAITLIFFEARDADAQAAKRKGTADPKAAKGLRDDDRFIGWRQRMEGAGEQGTCFFIVVIT